MVLAAVGLDNGSADGNTDEARKRDDGICRGVVPTVLLRLAQPPNTHRGDGDARPRSKAKQYRKDNTPSRRMSRRQPDTKTGHNREHDGPNARVEGPHDISIIPRQRTPNHRPGIHNGNQVVGETLVKPLMQRIRRDEGQRNEERELKEEEPEGREQEGLAAEDAEVGMGGGVLGRGEAALDEEDADDAAAEADEGEDAGRPAVADLVEEGRLHQGEDDAADASSCAGHARSEAAFRLEPVADGGDARCEEER